MIEPQLTNIKFTVAPDESRYLVTLSGEVALPKGPPPDREAHLANHRRCVSAIEQVLEGLMPLILYPRS